MRDPRREADERKSEQARMQEGKQGGVRGSSSTPTSRMLTRTGLELEFEQLGDFFHVLWGHQSRRDALYTAELVGAVIPLDRRRFRSLDVVSHTTSGLLYHPILEF
jgi:hypothetical protein